MTENTNSYVGELEKLDADSYAKVKRLDDGTLQKDGDKVRRWEMYRTTCDCKDDEHQITIDLEDDDGCRMITFWTKTHLCAWDSKPYWDDMRYDKKDIYPHFFSKLYGYLGDLKDYYISVVKYRVKHAVKMLFTGYIETQSEFLIRGDKQVLAIAEVIINFVGETYRKDDKESKSITHDPKGSGLVANGRVQVLVDQTQFPEMGATLFR